MSYHEGSNWQAKKEDEGKPLYGKEQFEKETNLRLSPNKEVLQSDEDKWDDIFDDWNIDQREISQRDWFKLYYHAPKKRKP